MCELFNDLTSAKVFLCVCLCFFMCVCSHLSVIICVNFIGRNPYKPKYRTAAVKMIEDVLVGLDRVLRLVWTKWFELKCYKSVPVAARRSVETSINISFLRAAFGVSLMLRLRSDILRLVQLSVSFFLRYHLDVHVTSLSQSKIPKNNGIAEGIDYIIRSENSVR